MRLPRPPSCIPSPPRLLAISARAHAQSTWRVTAHAVEKCLHRPQMLWRSNSIHREEAPRLWRAVDSLRSARRANDTQCVSVMSLTLCAILTPYSLSSSLSGSSSHSSSSRDSSKARSSRSPSIDSWPVSGAGSPIFFMNVSRCVTAGVIAAFKARPQWCPALRPPW